MLVAGGAGVLAGGPGFAGPAVPAGESARPMTEDEVVRLVTGLLPPGSVRKVAAEAPGATGPSGDVYRNAGLLRYDDGKGASTIAYVVERGALPPERAAVCVDPSGPKDSCDRTVRPDGSVLVIDRSRDATFTGRREWRGVYASPDGTVVRVVEDNGEDQANPTRDVPPLDAEQLTALVTAPDWRRLIAELPANPQAPSPEVPPPPLMETPGDPVAVLAGLLPKGASPAGEGDSNGVLVVTYDGRTSRLSVRVGPASPYGLAARKAAEEAPPAPLEARERLPDGTLVITYESGSGAGYVDQLPHWLARIYYPDGRSVVIDEWNDAAGPGRPAFSPERLKAMVMAPDWWR
ncbi:hypothetical protein GCM10009639_63210 [Kitasatospora putterlickiae]|uniref:Lipoprotein n=1 Tax=Kitasatospora putterlickiae TaxID=221725 RepID=A0ABN1YG63_9ACTN